MQGPALERCPDTGTRQQRSDALPDEFPARAARFGATITVAVAHADGSICISYSALHTGGGSKRARSELRRAGAAGLPFRILLRAQKPDRTARKRRAADLSLHAERCPLVCDRSREPYFGQRDAGCRRHRGAHRGDRPEEQPAAYKRPASNTSGTIGGCTQSPRERGRSRAEMANRNR